MKKLTDYIEESRLRNKLEEDIFNDDYLKEKIHLDKQVQQQRKKRFLYNLFSSIVILFVLLYGITILFKEDISINKLDFSTLAVLGVSATALSATLLMKYLQTDKEDSNSDKFIKDIYLNELSELKFKVESLKNKTGNNQNTEKNLSNIIDEYIKNKFTDSFIQNKIEANYKEEAIKSSKVNNLINYIENKSNRLDDEIIRLRKSANLNLVIGTLSTLIAIICLLYEVFYNEIDFKNNVEILSHYIPRISLVLFIEIFAFFFLKLYKSNLFEIKYFNNEKTNIEFKIFSLKTALLYEDKEMINACISNFINIERNFIIKKDESTIDLEKHKYDNLSNTDFKDLVLGFLKNNK